jgi:hypothetical protein
MAVQGFECFRYGFESGLADVTFLPVDGGVSRACRRASATDSSPDYYQLLSASSLDSCQSLCRSNSQCRGIEYSSSGRCELWTREIQSSKSVQGYTCLKLL